jgi:hypothetical protein
LSHDGASVQAESDGTIIFEVKKLYQTTVSKDIFTLYFALTSQIKIPMQINVEQVTAEFFQTKGVVLLTIPVVQSQTSTPHKKTISVVPQESSAKFSHLTAENELLLGAEPEPPKPAAKKDANAEEQTYPS